MQVYVFLPCYNEELNIADLIDSWNSHVQALAELGYGLHIFGIDDCSTDLTKEKIIEMTHKYNNVSLISHEVNKGLCGGLNTAISSYLQTGNRDSYMVLMDGDNTHDPKYVFALLSQIKLGYDCVIASRYCDTSDTIGVASHRKFLSDMARHYYRFMLRVPNVQDYTCGYRIYSYDIIKKLIDRLGPDPIKEKSFACMMEFLYDLHSVGAKFSEIGFALRYDKKKGESKMRIFKTMWKSLITAYNLKKQRSNL